MAHGRSRLIVASMLALAVVVLGTRSSPADESNAVPLIVPRPSAAQLGEQVTVDLQGWPPGGVTVALCGNDARRGSPDCDLSGAKTAEIRADGTGSVQLRTARPPIDCPCVIRVSTASNSIVRTAPIELADVPVLTPEERPSGAFEGNPASLLTVSATVDDGPSWSAVLGGHADRTLRLTLTNNGTTTLSGLTVTAAVGRGDDAGEPIAVPRLDPLGAGEVRTYEIPFTLGAPAVGTYVVAGRIIGLNDPIAIRTTTRNLPWALLLLLALIVCLAGMKVAHWARQRPGRGISQVDETSPEGDVPENTREVGGARGLVDEGLGYRPSLPRSSSPRSLSGSPLP